MYYIEVRVLGQGENLGLVDKNGHTGGGCGRLEGNRCENPTLCVLRVVMKGFERGCCYGERAIL